MTTTFRKKLIAFVVGLVSLYFAIACYNNQFGEHLIVSETDEVVQYGYICNRTYGADAYTDIQNANAITANNIIQLIYSTQRCFGMLYTLITILSFSVVLFYKDNNGKDNNDPDKNLPPIRNTIR